MPSELDHIFVCVSKGAPETAYLTAYGISEGAPNAHPGQGTACRRFFFHNAYLELLWVEDQAEAQSEAIHPTRLWERWAERDHGACPFGLCCRPATGIGGSPPFTFWSYRPPYLQQGLRIGIATNSDLLTEPLLFHLDFVRRPDSAALRQRQIIDHPAGLREITRVEFVLPSTENISPELGAAITDNIIRLRAGKQYQVQLGFDGERQGKRMDFYPDLPVVFCW